MSEQELSRIEHSIGLWQGEPALKADVLLLINQIRRTQRKATTVDLYTVEEAVGMGCGAWDMVDPLQIIEAAWRL